MSNHIRKPAVAGRFYEAVGQRCRADAERMSVGPASDEPALPQTLVGALVPHAGWICSGRVAGLTFRALQSRTQARTFILTGSVHTMAIPGPTLDSAEAWATPLGEAPVDIALRDALAELDDVTALDMAHQYEHSLEVQLPLMQVVFGEDIQIVPCLIPPDDRAPQWGQAIGRLLKDWPEPVIMIASSDLTHYGPNYSFTPHGVGGAGYRWAHDINDRQLLDKIEQMNAEAIVPETRTAHSACGGGAIAATITACTEQGAGRGYLLEHTDSTRELAEHGYRDESNSVGYAAVVFG